MSSVLNLQATIGKGDRYCDGEEQVGTIGERIRLDKKLYKKGLSWDQQAKEGVDKIQERALTEIDFIKSAINSLLKLIDERMRNVEVSSGVGFSKSMGENK